MEVGGARRLAVARNCKPQGRTDRKKKREMRETEAGEGHQALSSGLVELLRVGALDKLVYSSSVEYRVWPISILATGQLRVSGKCSRTSSGNNARLWRRTSGKCLEVQMQEELYPGRGIEHELWARARGWGS